MVMFYNHGAVQAVIEIFPSRSLISSTNEFLGNTLHYLPVKGIGLYNRVLALP